MLVKLPPVVPDEVPLMIVETERLTTSFTPINKSNKPIKSLSLNLYYQYNNKFYS